VGHSKLSPDPRIDIFYAFGKVYAIGPGKGKSGCLESAKGVIFGIFREKGGNRASKILISNPKDRFHESAINEISSVIIWMTCFESSSCEIGSQ